MSCRRLRIATLALAGLILASSTAHAQYFGRNKVQYRTFDFRVLHTEHVDVYFYVEEEDSARLIGRMAERWLTRLSTFFDHQLRGRQSVILYASTEDFRQTNAVEGLIGEGTGGVTELLKRRIVVPMAGSIADTDHVLGHELVHAFQFDMTGADPRDAERAVPGILSYPLWFVEGMAEYLSIGPVDAQTSMWLRDGAITGRMPTLRQLNDPHFFPYRWGEAFWAYVGARWGDRQIASLLRSAANPRFDLDGMMAQLGTTPADFEHAWHQSMRDAEQAVDRDRATAESHARRVIALETGAGRINIGPRLSPDGSQLAFFSERDKFSIDLYVADVASGRITRKLVRTATDPHFDSLQFLNSAGAWSPDGTTLALTVVRNGRPALALIDARSGDVRRELPLGTLNDAISPAWAPDGHSLVFSGNDGGLTDLFRLSLDTGKVDRLTHDAYGDFEPVFTPDGQSIVFVTERFTTDLDALTPGAMRLARLDVATGAVTPVAAFLHGKHLSPQVSADGRTLVFIAEPDGVSNLYRMPIDGGPIEQITSVLTGIAGITTSSPALSMAAANGRLAFSVFEKDGDAIYVLDPADIVATVPPPASTRAAVLPTRQTGEGQVFGLVNNFARGLPPSSATPSLTPYKDKLHLDMIGQPSLSVGYSQWGNVLGGSVSALFSDLLGDRVLSMGVAAGGTLDDIGGQVTLLDRRHRWNWGAAAELAPNRTDLFAIDLAPDGQQFTVSQLIFRRISQGLFGLTSAPINTVDRVEFSGGVRHYLSLTEEVRARTFDQTTGDLLDQSDTKTVISRPLSLLQTGAAFVHDTSYYGATSPIFGQRYRFEVGQSTGTLHYTSLLADFRQYFMTWRPITVAMRAISAGRYGEGASDTALTPLFIGQPELVHGYGFTSFKSSECAPGPSGGTCEVIDRLIGTRMLIGNIEVRAPLAGLFSHDLIYGRVPIEIAGFYDAGIAWDAASRPSFAGGDRGAIRSTGAAIRVNVLGAIVLELSAAHPFSRDDHSLQWQFGVRQGF